MKLLTHNMLTSHVRGVREGYPLALQGYFKDLSGAGLPFYSHPRFGPKASKDSRRRKHAQATEVKVSTVDFNQEFVAKMIPKLEWGALVEAADSVGHLSDLPKELISDFQTNEEFLRKVHHVLLEVEVIEGTLKCPESGKEFPINKGIPNLLLKEEES